MSQGQPRSPAVFGTPEEIAYEARAQEGAIWTGSRLLIGIAGFAFASLAFAYFYLRSSNSEDLWRPGNITAPTGLGAAVMAAALASSLLFGFGLDRLRKNQTTDWEAAGWIAVLGGLLALGLQIYELTDLPFHPGSSGYASCFIGWASMNIVLLLGGVYWMETLLARHVRLRRAIEQEGAHDRATSLVPRIFRVNAESCAYFMGFSALVSVLFWLFFYVI